jgi:hypothetical protein
MSDIAILFLTPMIFAFIVVGAFAWNVKAAVRAAVVIGLMTIGLVAAGIAADIHRRSAPHKSPADWGATPLRQGAR